MGERTRRAKGGDGRVGRYGRPMRTRGDHFEVVKERGGIVRVVRLPNDFASMADMEEAMEELNAHLDSLGRAKLLLLVDTRRAKPRNDPEFEAAFAPHRKRMLSGFKQQAVLVRTEVGRLQVNRHARMDGTELQAFCDEKKAVRWLLV